MPEQSGKLSSARIVADLAGSNPNVMYEVGVGHGLKKPPLLILQEGGTQVPAAFNDYPIAEFILPLIIADSKDNVSWASFQQAEDRITELLG